MKRTLLWFVPFVLLPLTGLAASNHDGAFDDEDGRPFLSFGSMYGVDGAFISNNVIRGVLGDECLGHSAVEHMGAVRGDVDVFEQVPMHERPVALRVARRDRVILVEVVGRYVPE